MSNVHDFGVASEAAIVAKAKHGLELVGQGEAMTIEGWLEYGTALNEERARIDTEHKGVGKPQRDVLFGEWVKENGLDVIRCGNLPHRKVERHERVAAMWAASEPENFKKSQNLFKKARAVRGWHKKWEGHLEAERVKAEAEAKAKRRREEAAKKGSDGGAAARERARTAQEQAERDAAERVKAATEAKAKMAENAKAADERVKQARENEAKERAEQAAKPKKTAEEILAENMKPGRTTPDGRPVDPEFDGSEIEFVQKYGHIQTKTAEEWATERFGSWARAADFAVKHVEKMRPDRPLDLNWLRKPNSEDVAKMANALQELAILVIEMQEMLARAQDKRANFKVVE